MTVPSDVAGLKLWLDAQTQVYKSGKAAQFTRANSEYLSIASNADVQTGDIDFTIALWVNFDSIGAFDQTFIGKDASGAREFYIQHRNGTGFRGAVFRGGADQIVAAGVTPGAGTWYLVLFWHDATANSVNIQVNNGSVATTGIAGALDAASGTELRIGARAFSGFQDYIGGRVQNAGFWKRVLTSTERSSLYNSGNGKAYGDLTTAEKVSLVSWWALDEASGSRADSHGSNTLTDNNTVTQGSGKVYSLDVAGNGDTVGLWKDQSGQGSHAYANIAPTYSTAVAAINSKNALDFSAHAMSSAESRARKPMTMAAVIRPDAVSGSSRYVMGATASSGYQMLIGSGAQWQVSGGSGGPGLGASGTTLSAASPYILVFTYDGSGNYVYRTNGAVSASGTNNQTPGASTMILGASTIAAANPFDGLLAEVLSYDSVLSASDMSGIESYLATKYGISLPGGGRRRSTCSFL